MVKVGIDVGADLREDGEAHGGRHVAAERRAWWVIGIVLLLVLLLIVLPLLLADDSENCRTFGSAGPRSSRGRSG